MNMLLIAKEAINYAREIIQINEQAIMQGKQESLVTKEANQKISDLRMKTRGMTPLQSVALIKEAKAGNCQEYAILVMEYLSQLKLENINAEVLRLEHKQFDPTEDVDHVVVVINRNKHSTLSDPISWGNDTILLDPLFNLILKPSDIEEKLPVPVLSSSKDYHGHACKFFVKQRYQFALHYNLEEFKKNNYPRPIPHAYRSLIQWSWDQLQRHQQNKKFFLYPNGDNKKRAQFLAEKPFIMSRL